MVGGGIKLPPPLQQKTNTFIANYFKSFDTFGRRPFIIQIYET